MDFHTDLSGCKKPKKGQKGPKMDYRWFSKVSFMGSEAIRYSDTMTSYSYPNFMTNSKIRPVDFLSMLAEIVLNITSQIAL